jgi:enoyl-[acyl-carrier protein] reductase III
MSGLSNPFVFDGYRVLVTGGTRGIGAAIARAFAAHGASVVINYSRDHAAAERTRLAIEADGGVAEFVQANVAQPDEVRQLVERVREGGTIDVIVHAAAIGSFKPTSDVRANQWDLTMNVCARALLLLAEHAGPHLTNGRGRLLSLSSRGSVRVVPRYGAIGVAKGALESLTRYLAAEFAPRGITVNALAPGLVEGTSLASHPEFAALAVGAAARTPIGRLATVDDMVPLALFLCSPAAAWIVGETIVADGGHSLCL